MSTKINIGPNGLGPFIQPGYTYGVNDSGPWQRFVKKGPTAQVQDYADVLLAANWNVTVTLLAAGLAQVEGSAGWPFPYLYGTENPENIWELDPAEEPKSLLEADFPNSTVLNLSTSISNTIDSR